MTQEESMVFAIKIETWSATDYSYLDNNQLGWVSDDQEWYLFDDEKKMTQYKQYLQQVATPPSTVGARQGERTT